MKALIRSLIVFCFLAAGANEAAAGSFKAGGALYNVKTRPLTELHFKNIVRQQFDLSCGAAAMATLLRYFYEQSVSEQEVIEAMVKYGDPEKIGEAGFSMLELKQFAESRGFVSRGYRVKDAEKIRNLEVPVIALVNTRGYAHFVVLKGFLGDEVHIADPAFGNVVKSFRQFKQEWSNVFLVVLSAELNGESQFAQDFSIKAPMSEITLLTTRGYRAPTPGAGEF